MARSTTTQGRTSGGLLHAAFSCSSLFVAIPIIASYWISGRSAMEKVITQMAQPLFIGCFIIFTCSMVLASRHEKGVARLLFLIGILLWISSTPYFVGRVARHWESQNLCVDLTSMKPYDIVVVLGGGTATRPTGDPQLGSSGDRVGFAARMYHLGLAKKLVTTGETLHLTGSLGGRFEQSDAPSRQTKRLWIELGVPESAIEMLDGENTSSEIANLAKQIELHDGKRCGLLTSAFHMPRAMKLAKEAKLQVEPIAVDFKTSPTNHPLTVEAFLPSPAAMELLSKLIKEWLAMRIGR